MMINNNNKQIADMLDFLAGQGVSSGDRALAEQYLQGNVGDEILDQFQYIDFAATAATYDVVSASSKIMADLAKTEKRQVCIRFFKVLFAVGRSTCHALLSHSVIDGLLHAKECELYKAVTVYIGWALAVNGTGYLHAHQLDHLIQVARSDIARFRESIDRVRGEGSKYFLSATAVYFCTRYGVIKSLEEEDMALMQMYEEELLGCLDQWLELKYCSEHSRIAAAIREHRLGKDMLDCVRNYNITEEERRQLSLLGGMAYLNFQLSDVLLDAARTCLAIDPEWMLFTFADVSVGTLDASRRISSKGGDYDDLFWIDPETYIRWAAVKEYPRILKRQLAKNQKSYLRAMDEDGFRVLLAKKSQTAWVVSVPDSAAATAVNFLRDLLEKENPALYKQSGADQPNYERVIQNILESVRAPHTDVAREYLRGNCAVSALYPYAEEFYEAYIPNSYLQEKRRCSDPAFFGRCRTFMALACSEYTPVVEDEDNKDVLQGVEDFYQTLDGEQMDIAHQLTGFVTAYKSYNSLRHCSLDQLMEGSINVFARYLDMRREETLAAFAGAKAEGRYLALRVMRKDAARYKEEILSYASDGSKLVRDELLDILENTPLVDSAAGGGKVRDWLEAVRTLLAGKKAAQRELAVQVLMRWQQEDGDSAYDALLRQAMEQEKNAKVLNLLQDALHIQEGAGQEETITIEELVKQLHKGNRKKGLAWAYSAPFPTVHTRDGGEASEEYLQAILLSYAAQDKCGINRNAQRLAGELNPAEFARYMVELFDRWLAAGAESKRRWVLYAASIHGGEDIVQKMQHQIREWPQQARGALASEAVRALALSPSPGALLIVDGIARKFKFKQVRAAAGDALEFAASELGITREELSDRIVPDLGFDEKMQRTFDYGERVFRVMLTAALDLEVYDENGKKLKNLPSPGKKDDAEKASAAYEAFKQLKKQMKTTVSSQKARLEYALTTKREWTVEAWKALFVRNPLMHQFAIGLIWGVYEDNQLTQSFRYMEDGSFNTQDAEEYELPEGARISLVHPIELSDAEMEAWREQLADYEITQPIEQLDRTVYRMTEQEAGSKCLERFGGYSVNDLSLHGKLTGLGWYRGSVLDAGGFDTYYREDAELGIGVELHFSGAWVVGMNEDVTLYEARFYKAGTVARGSYVYDEVDDKRAYLLKDIPPRYFSEIALQLAGVAASSGGERDENWRKEAGLAK